MSEHYDNPFDTDVLTEAETLALQESLGRHNPPKIPVRACPPPPARKFLTASRSFKVHVGTLNAKHDAMTFNCEPTADLIVQVLMLERDDMDEYFRNTERPTDDDVKRHDREWKRYESLIALVKLAGEITLPAPGDNWNHQVFVAGVEIGHLNIQAQKAWTLE